MGLVDDGPYVSRSTLRASAIRDYLVNGYGNTYVFAIRDGGMRHTVLNVGIRELVSVQNDGTTTYVPVSLEARLSTAIKWNTANPTKKLTVHVRFHVGETAPDKWKELCGTVNMTDPQFNQSAIAARWWVKNGSDYTYRRLYKNAMDALGPAVDAINTASATKNLIGTVNAPGEALNYREPMIIYAASDSVRANLVAGGFTAAEHNAFMKWFPSAASAFKTVGVELAVNPSQNIDVNGNYSGANTEMYKDVAAALISTVGAKRTVIANYSARQLFMQQASGSYYNMYNWMSSMAKASDPVWVGVQMGRPHHVAMGHSDTNEQWDDVARLAAGKGFHFAETTGPRAKPLTEAPPCGLANIWPTSYHDDSNDVSDIVAINTLFAKNPHPAITTTSATTSATPTSPPPTSPTPTPTSPPPTGSTAAYLTILWKESVWQSATSGNYNKTDSTRTLQQNADNLKAKGMFGVGTVAVGKTADSYQACYNKEMKLSSWSDLAFLRDKYNWKFISQGQNGTNMTTLTSDAQRSAESTATMSVFTSRGHNKAWGAYAYPDGSQDTASQKIVSQKFALGRKYVDGRNAKTSVSTFPYAMNTFVVTGGSCNLTGQACAANSVSDGTRTTSLDALTSVLNPAADQWSVLQSDRIVEGKKGALGEPYAWDCTSTDWRARWTSRSGLFCRNSMLEALDTRNKAAVVTDPASVAEAWGVTLTGR